MSITKLFQISSQTPGMRDTKETGSAVCELLLVVFFLGALLCTLRRAGIFGLPFTPPGGAASWIAGILAVDAVMAGSLLAWYVLPVTTLLFGAAASAAGNALLDMPAHGSDPLCALGLESHRGGGDAQGAHSARAREKHLRGGPASAAGYGVRGFSCIFSSSAWTDIKLLWKGGRLNAEFRVHRDV